MGRDRRVLVGMLTVPDALGLVVALDFDRVAHHARGERLPVAG